MSDTHSHLGSSLCLCLNVVDDGSGLSISVGHRLGVAGLAGLAHGLSIRCSLGVSTIGCGSRGGRGGGLGLWRGGQSQNSQVGSTTSNKQQGHRVWSTLTTQQHPDAWSVPPDRMSVRQPRSLSCCLRATASCKSHNTPAAEHAGCLRRQETRRRQQHSTAGDKATYSVPSVQGWAQGRAADQDHRRLKTAEEAPTCCAQAGRLPARCCCVRRTQISLCRQRLSHHAPSVPRMRS